MFSSSTRHDLDALDHFWARRCAGRRGAGGVSRKSSPQPGWVEHDPESLWRTTLSTARQALSRAGVEPSAIAGLGITTTSVKRRWSGAVRRAVLHPQCDRLAGIAGRAPVCAELKGRGCETPVSARAGLLLDPYFSATKIAWILEATMFQALAPAERGGPGFRHRRQLSRLAP